MIRSFDSGEYALAQDRFAESVKHTYIITVRTLGDSFTTRAKLFYGIAVVFLLAIQPEIIVPLLKPVFLGWAIYLMRVLPMARVNWGAVVYAGVCLILLVGGSHLFLRWLYRGLHDASWRLKWTLSGSTVIALLFFASMSVMGLAHQTAWLITSPYPLTERRADWGCMSNMHQIGLAIEIYAQEHGGNYPPDLATLLMGEPLTAVVFICPSSDDVAASDATAQASVDGLRTPGHCSYIYLGKGLRQPVAESRVTLIEPPRNHGGDGMNVLFGDGHVEWVDRQRASEIWDQYISGGERE
jgi:prepilin-type processing-associated H-X9-DG protein